MKKKLNGPYAVSIRKYIIWEHNIDVKKKHFKIIWSNFDFKFNFKKKKKVCSDCSKEKWITVMH